MKSKISKMNNTLPLDDFVKTDDAIFHYTRASVALEKILFDGRFRLSLLKDTNDPFEYKFRFLGMLGGALPPEAKKLYNEAHHVFDRIVRMESRIMSFCSNKAPEIILDTEETIEDIIANSIGWNKPRMWAQYGENHQGICLVFSRKAIEADFANISERVIAKNIQYKTEPGISHDAITLNGNQLVEEGVEDYCKCHVARHTEALFFIKHIDYRDESEYRVVVFDPDHRYEYIDINKSIRGIIAGEKTHKVYFPLTRKLADRYGIECRRIYWNRGTPYLLLCKDDENI